MTDFECCVYLYDQKYKITIPWTHDCVRFSDLYPKIQQIDKKQNISFETNTFEIFDLRRERFKRIISFEETIDNYSRVRVLIKPQVFKDYLSDKRSDVNSYQTTDGHYFGHTLGQRLDQNSDKNQNHVLNNFRFPENYNNNYKIDINSNYRQMNDSRVWEQSSGSSLRELFGGQSMRTLNDPSIVSAVEPLVMATSTEKNPLNSDFRTNYCPKVVDYSNSSSDFDKSYNLSDYNVNNYQTVSTTQINSNSGQTVDYVYNKLIESRNIFIKQQTIEQLRREGVEVKQNFNFETYLCKVCDECFQTSESALNHIKSIEHFDQKSGKFPNELDRSLIIPTEYLSDIKVVLSRKQELKKLDLKTKYDFLRHGIRIKDGMGGNAYVCISCKVSFISYNYVRHHLAKFMSSPEHHSDIVYTSTTFKPSKAVTPRRRSQSPSKEFWSRRSRKRNRNQISSLLDPNLNSITESLLNSKEKGGIHQLKGVNPKASGILHFAAKEYREKSEELNKYSDKSVEENRRKRKRKRKRNRNRDKRPEICSVDYKTPKEIITID